MLGTHAQLGFHDMRAVCSLVIDPSRLKRHGDNRLAMPVDGVRPSTRAVMQDYAGTASALAVSCISDEQIL